MRLLFRMSVALAVTFTPPLAAQVFDAGCLLPFASIQQQRPIDTSCPKLTGDVPDPTSPKGLQDAVKNNFCMTGSAARVTFFTFTKLQSKVDQIPGALTWNHDNLPADRSGFTKVYKTSDGVTLGEGSLVRLAAWVLKSKPGHKESVNCDLNDKKIDNDLHVVLVKTSAHDASECGSVTAETSPHFRPDEWDGSKILEAQNHPFRFTGQLMYDASHRPCSGTGSGSPARISSWEIHPVYKIDVCEHKSLASCSATDNSVWKAIENWSEPD